MGQNRFFRCPEAISAKYGHRAGLSIIGIFLFPKPILKLLGNAAQYVLAYRIELPNHPLWLGMTESTLSTKSDRSGDNAGECCPCDVREKSS